MLKREGNFFTALLHCLKRTKEQRVFEEKLYSMGLENEQRLMIERLNAKIPSKDIALKFVLQELDVASEGGASLQDFVKKSGFYTSEYAGAVMKFEGEQEEIEEIQIPFFIFLNKISDEKRMNQTVIKVLNGVMEHWKIGKYSDERRMDIREEILEEVAEINAKKRASFTPLMEKFTSTLTKKLPFLALDDKTKASLMLFLKNFKSALMKKLIIIDDKIQDLLDSFSPPKVEKPLKIYSDDYVNELMEKYSNVIPFIITGEVSEEHAQAIKTFQSEMSLASLEGHSFARVFCAFFETKSSVPLSKMDETSRLFFIQILNAFDEQGFSESLTHYFEENRDEVYLLAQQGDKFMQYLIAFWYVFDHEDKNKIEEEAYFWYRESASNGFEPAIKKLKAYILNGEEKR